MRYRMNRIVSAAASGLLCSSAGAATIFVSPCGNNGWTGANPVCVAAVGPKRTIQAGINAANPGDFVHVLPGTYVEKIDLNGKAITLLGTGGAASTIIDGNNNGTVVTLNSLEGPGTVIRGFTIRNGNAAQGGGMLIALANPTIEECVIRENFADDEGAGAAIIAASPTFTDCDFVENEADVGGGDSEGSGGGVYVSGGSPSFTGCLFLHNHGNDAGGGAMLMNASPTFTDCRFEENANWSYCFAEPCNPPKAGSAVLSLTSAPVFEGCEFVHNYTGGHGAVAVSGGSAAFSACGFSLNQSVWTPDPAQHGGALAGQEGADLTLFGCSFTDNQSNNSAGAIHLQDSSLSASLCGFSNNIANDGKGGVIEATDSSVALNGCTLFQNRSTEGGGAIATTGGALTVSSSSFSSNTADDSLPLGDDDIEASGGAIEAIDTHVETAGCTFTGNASRYKGGAIAYNPNEFGSFDDPAAANVVIDDCTFAGNTTRYGGGVNMDAGTLHVADSTFDSNEAIEIDGWGAVGAGLGVGIGGYARVASSEFRSNTSQLGGAVGCFGDLDAVGCTITDNSAEDGGGVYVSTNQSNARLYSCLLSGNDATDDGAAAYLGTSGALSLFNCVVYRNTSPAGGAAIVTGATNVPLTITNCTIHFNSGGGGVISNDAGTQVFISNSIVWGHLSGPEIAIFQGAVEFSDVQGGHPGEGNIDANPLWVGAAGGNYLLTPDSPCIDAGRTMALPPDAPDLDVDANLLELLPVDFDGNPRVTDNLGKADSGCSAGTVVDMGAFEAPGTPSPPIMPGDANADGAINFADLTFVLTNWGPCAPCCPGDVDGNGEVGFSDITKVLETWG